MSLDSGPGDGQPCLGTARLLDSQHPTRWTFWGAFQKDYIVIAVQLASDQGPGALTYGLNHAFHWGHFNLAQQLLNIGAQYDSDSLEIASDLIETIIMIVAHGFNVNTALWNGATVLSMAVYYKNESVIRYLLRRGANPNLGLQRNPQGSIDQIRSVPNSRHVLNRAARYCGPEIFALLLAHGAVLSDCPMALHRATNVPKMVLPGARIPMLEYLLGLGLDTNAIDDEIKIADDGRGRWGSPLHYAVKWGRVEEARWLLQHGADPDLKTPWGISARDRVKKSFSPYHALSILFESE